MATAGALQDQERMTQGQDFSFESEPRSEEGRDGEEQGDEKGKQGSGQPIRRSLTNSIASIRTDFLLGDAGVHNKSTQQKIRTAQTLTLYRMVRILLQFSAIAPDKRRSAYPN
jgi:hypothetical protein